MKTEGLNFLEAVEALENGRCTGIRRNGWFTILRVSADGRLDLENLQDIKNILARNWELVDPKKKMINVVYRADPHSPNSVWYIDEKGITRQAPRDAQISVKFDMEMPEHEPLVLEGKVFGADCCQLSVSLSSIFNNFEILNGKKVKIEVLGEQE